MNALNHKIPPPIVALLIAAAMWAIARFSPILQITAAVRLPIAGALAVCGALVAASGMLAFRRARTTINPVTPAAASSVVTVGIYRYTRNPMYVGLACLLLAWTAYLASPLALLGPAAFVLFITRFQIIPEERALLSKFGQQYADYRVCARRWV